MDKKNIIIGILLLANLGLSSYTINSVNALKSETQEKQSEILTAIQNKEFKLSEKDAQLVAAKSALFNQQLKAEMTTELEKNRQAFQIYSDQYIQELISNTRNVIQTLYPEGSKAEYSKERFEALMSEMDLENHDRAVNTGVIEGKTSKEILQSQNLIENDLAEQEKIIFLRLKSLMPEKSDLEIMQMMASKKYYPLKKVNSLK